MIHILLSVMKKASASELLENLKKWFLDTDSIYKVINQNDCMAKIVTKISVSKGLNKFSFHKNVFSRIVWELSKYFHLISIFSFHKKTLTIKMWRMIFLYFENNNQNYLTLTLACPYFYNSYYDNIYTVLHIFYNF